MGTKSRIRRADSKRKYLMQRLVLSSIGLSVLIIVGVVVLRTWSPAGGRHPEEGIIAFGEAKTQAAEFITKYNTIVLTADQMQTRTEALTPIPAPCCREYSIDTCCCPCNLAKSTWGLAGVLIAEHGLDAPAVRSEVERWLEFTNRNGYTGDACHQGRCERPFDQNGCGGMDEDRISLAR